MLYPRIRELRKERDYTQAEIAEYLFVAQNTYSQYETGEIPIKSEMLVRLADFLETSVDYLLGISDKKEAPKK